MNRGGEGKTAMPGTRWKKKVPIFDTESEAKL
jgi:hypothetical protein